jgi:preprotein translocase subunit SecA
MATDAQNEANRKNALASTGPQTPEGKSTSSRNAVSHGLFAASDTVQPDEQTEFADLTAAMQNDLTPEGPLEQTLAHEIIRAAWRLRRCAKVEDSLTAVDPFTDPMANNATLGTQNAVDRARLQTHRILLRSMAELRRLQNERRFRTEILPDDVNRGLGLTSFKQLMPALLAEKRLQLMNRQPQTETKKQSQSAPAGSATKQTQFVPRNAPCPCGSGQKYKRCCGHYAPAASGLAA